MMDDSLPEMSDNVEVELEESETQKQIDSAVYAFELMRPRTATTTQAPVINEATRLYIELTEFILNNTNRGSDTADAAIGRLWESKQFLMMSILSNGDF